MKQALHLFEFSLELGEKKIDWIPSRLRRQESDKEDTPEMEREKEKTMNALKTINSYFINTLILDPWHYIIYWRNLTDFNGLSFFLNFQILSETEHECFGVYYEGLDFPGKQKFDERTSVYASLQTIFKSFNIQRGMNGLSNSNGDSQNTTGLKIKIYSKADLMKFVAQLTLFFERIDKYIRDRQSAAANSSTHASQNSQA